MKSCLACPPVRLTMRPLKARRVYRFVQCFGPLSAERRMRGGPRALLTVSQLMFFFFFLVSLFCCCRVCLQGGDGTGTDVSLGAGEGHERHGDAKEGSGKFLNTLEMLYIVLNLVRYWCGDGSFPPYFNQVKNVLRSSCLKPKYGGSRFFPLFFIAYWYYANGDGDSGVGLFPVVQ